MFSGGRNKTHNNERFVRFWWEVAVNSKWRVYSNGGQFRKWYGNDMEVVDWSASAKSFYAKCGGLLNEKFVDKEGLTWNAIASGNPSFRIKPMHSIHSSVSPTVFNHNYQCNFFLLGFLNSVVSIELSKIINPTLHTLVSDVLDLPDLSEKTDKTTLECISALSTQCIALTHTDWDNFEASRDFKVFPLMTYKTVTNLKYETNNATVEQTFKSWEIDTDKQFAQLKANEEELNRIFIDIYGLQDELTPKVEDKDVTIRKADLGRDIRSFVSYAVGCMFGRYSLDESGLILAGGTFDEARYTIYPPAKDNIIPIGTADYFNNDIVLRFVEFVSKVYGEATLSENLDFIANAIYPNASGTARERIRRYFHNDFYKDHVKIYLKRPIYWLMNSGKKDGFKALFYLHRYDKYTMARARTEYLHPLQRKYDAEVKRMELLAAETENSRDKASIRKVVGILRNQIDECRIYDQVLAHIAHQQIILDLDDGVKVNYAKFQGVEVAKDDGTADKMDLLGRI